jgi:hypothetical protein
MQQYVSSVAISIPQVMGHQLGNTITETSPSVLLDLHTYWVLYIILFKKEKVSEDGSAYIM